MKENKIFKKILEDPTLIEKLHVSPEEIKTARYDEDTGVRILEIIKKIINNVDETTQQVYVSIKREHGTPPSK